MCDKPAISAVDSLLNRITNDFSHQTPTTEQMVRYTEIRYRARELAKLIVELTPLSREQSIALTNLEQVVFWANASIARHE